MPAILPSFKIDDDSMLAEYFMPQQVAWILAEDQLHAQHKQVFALAEKSVQIGWITNSIACSISASNACPTATSVTSPPTFNPSACCPSRPLHLNPSRIPAMEIFDLDANSPRPSKRP